MHCILTLCPCITPCPCITTDSVDQHHHYYQYILSTHHINTLPLVLALPHSLPVALPFILAYPSTDSVDQHHHGRSPSPVSGGGVGGLLRHAETPPKTARYTHLHLILPTAPNLNQRAN